MAGRATSEGPEGFPFDPTLDPESQQGLDRLRCIADRALAANLFVLYAAAERNTVAAATGNRDLQTQRVNQLRVLQTVATRALTGELGPKSKELADSLLLDERGDRRSDERSLREFAFGLRELRRLAG